MTGDDKIWELLGGEKLSQLEKAVLREVWGHRGAENAVKLRTIAAAIGCWKQKGTERLIKKAVERLVRVHGVKIGSSKGAHSPAGYYLVRGAEDLKLALREIMAQVRAERDRAIRLGIEERVFDAEYRQMMLFGKAA